METAVTITDQDIVKEDPKTLVSPKNPTLIPIVSNIDQTLLFPVGSVFFYEVTTGSIVLDVAERVKKSVSDVLLVPYYFMAGRLKFNGEASWFELVCNSAGVLFVSAISRLSLKDLGDLRHPNQLFPHLILRTSRSKDDITKTPRFTVQAILTISHSWI
ncbi:hypothetical protein GIB67_006913 [Kingdonia uniflora]|uniref:Uncharacterized protein n=1 Tax=Kingdonia uniflora TaxID=39325 RepID=A0A7J7L075_9MAGN|nr:hypothetical protein GIB67_006913 [Kingdonia uniflora]